MSRWWRVAFQALGYGLLLVIFLAGIAVASLLALPQIPVWLAQQVDEAQPNLALGTIEGTLATGFKLSSLRWESETQRLEAEQVVVTPDWRALLWAQLRLSRLEVGSLRVTVLQPAPPRSEPLALPTVSLPLRWAIQRLSLPEITYEPYAGTPLTLAVQAQLSGWRQQVTVDTLQLRHSVGSVALRGTLQLAAHWPMQWQALLRLKAPASEKLLSAETGLQLQIQGDVSALSVALAPHRPATRNPSVAPPWTLQAELNLVPVEWTLSSSLSWLRSTPAQRGGLLPDWIIEPGTLTLQGSAQALSGALDLSLLLAENSRLPWPAGVSRRSSLRGPWSFQQRDSGLQAEMDWQGRFANRPWSMQAQVSQAPGQALITQGQLMWADASARWQANLQQGLTADLKIPRLAQWHTEASGGVALTARVTGDLTAADPAAIGAVSLNLSATQLRWQSTAVADLLRVTLQGNPRRHQSELRWQRETQSVSARLAGQIDGGLDAATLRGWQGGLDAVTIRGFPGGHWQQQGVAPIRWQHRAQALSLRQACLTQSPVVACLNVSTLPSLWSTELNIDAGSWGRGQVVARRDPRLKEPPLDVALRLDQLNVQALPLPVPEGLKLQGQLAGALTVRGTMAAPLAEGRLTLQNSRLSWPAYLLDWPELSAELIVAGDQGRLTAGLLDSQGGRATLAGDIVWRPEVRADLTLNGAGLLAGQAGLVRLTLEPTMRLQWAPEQMAVTGTLRIPAGALTLTAPAPGDPQLSPDVVVVRDAQGRDPRPPVTAGSTRALLLDVTAALGERVTVSGYGLAARVLGQVRVTQRPGSLLTGQGEIRLSDDAVIDAFGQRLSITQARAQFAGPLLRPQIAAEAVRRVNGDRVGVRVQGQPPRPNITFFSDQPMSQEDILASLILGRSLGEAGNTSTADQQALALAAALRLTGKTGLMDRVGERLGIREFTVGTQGKSTATEVAVSGYVRPDLHVSVGVGIFEPSQSVRVRYQVTPKLSLEALSALESAITLFYTFRR